VSARLLFPDSEAAADALTFAGRAGALDREAAVHLRGKGGVLTMSTAVLASRGLLDATPTVLAMRVLPVDPELECDLSVPAAQLSAASDTTIELGETAVRPAWTGVTPPRAGWEPSGRIASDVLAARAQWGMAAVADALPNDPGEEIVRAARLRVWGEPDEALDSQLRAVAFGAVAMGFVLGEEDARLFSASGWTRLSLSRGHILVRVPMRSGMTAVRTTGI
jgi:hypothetical protein